MGRIERLETINPKRTKDGKSEILREWRQDLSRKEIRQLRDQGAILYLEEGRVTGYICLKGLRFKGAKDREQLEEWRDKLAQLVVAERMVEGLGGDWQAWWLEPLRRSSRRLGFRGKLWKREAQEAEEVSMQEIGGYSPKYRHSKHRQEVRHNLKRLAKRINRNLGRKDKS